VKTVLIELNMVSVELKVKNFQRIQAIKNIFPIQDTSILINTLSSRTFFGALYKFLISIVVCFHQKFDFHVPS
jgi:hypothetical protein